MSDRPDFLATRSVDANDAAPQDQLRTLFIDIANEMAAERISPLDLKALDIVGLDDGITPDSRDLDLILRQVFGGTRPSITVAKHSPGFPKDALSVYARAARRKPSDSSAVIYHGMTLPELSLQYSPRAAVPRHHEIFAAWSRDGAAFLDSRNVLRDRRYGPGASETYDFFPAARGGAPLHVFFHGGFWQGSDKADNCQFLAGFLDAGWAVAVVNYDLCPVVTLGEIVDETRRAIASIYTDPQLNFDRSRMQVSGHSAGGHIVGMLLATDWPAFKDGMPPNPIHSAVMISGLFDLEPISLLPFAPLLGFAGNDEVKALSPVSWIPRQDIPMVLAVGGDESAEFHRQSEALAECWKDHVTTIDVVRIPNTNHFDVLETLANGSLRDIALSL